MIKLPKEPGEEELKAHDHEGQCDVERADFRNVLGLHALTNRPQFVSANRTEHTEAAEEHQGPQHPEQVHRLVAETADERNGQQVEESVDEALQTELGDPVFAGPVLDHLLADASKPRLFGEHGNVPVHLPIDLDRPNDLPAIRLQDRS